MLKVKDEGRNGKWYCNVEGQGQRQGLQWIVLIKTYTYMDVKFERVITNSAPLTD